MWPFNKKEKVIILSDIGKKVISDLEKIPWQEWSIVYHYPSASFFHDSLPYGIVGSTGFGDYEYSKLDIYDGKTNQCLGYKFSLKEQEIIFYKLDLIEKNQKVLKEVEEKQVKENRLKEIFG